MGKDKGPENSSISHNGTFFLFLVQERKDPIAKRINSLILKIVE